MPVRDFRLMSYFYTVLLFIITEREIASEYVIYCASLM